MEMQKTILKKIRYSGISLHTGNEAHIIFKPALPDTGIRFIRTDLSPKSEITAHVSKAVDIVRGTNIKEGEAKIYTVEHLLATLVGFGIDNLIIELDSSEPPVGDGSAGIFVDMIKKAGIKEQSLPRRFLKLKKPVYICKGSSSIVAVPSDKFIISCTIAFNHPEANVQYLTLAIDQQVFEKEISPARTFCFYHEVEDLMNKGLIKGGSLDNAVVIGDNAIFSKEHLRFKDEFVRHKILDLMGDLCLIGRPIKAHIIAIKPGHSINIDIAKRICESAEQKDTVISKDALQSKTELDINQIMKILPHRYPFLLVDRILSITDKKIVGIKNVSINEAFFKGHFPQRPVMPGVLVIEALAQTGGVLMLKKSENAGKLAYFTSIDKVKFRRVVMPGDQIRLEINVVKLRKNMGKVHGNAFVDNSLVAEADLMFAIVNAE